MRLRNVSLSFAEISGRIDDAASSYLPISFVGDYDCEACGSAPLPARLGPRSQFASNVRQLRRKP